MNRTPDSQTDPHGHEGRKTADIHYLGNPYDPPLDAIICNARRLQEFLIETGALDGRPLPFPELAQPGSGD